MAEKQKDKPDHVVEYTVNGEPFSTPDKVQTPAQIMTAAHVDTAQNYLVEIEGHHQRSYQDSPGAQIHMHEHQRFITIFMGPTPVSQCGRING